MEQFKTTLVYGYCKLDSWFEFDGEKFIGMGSKEEYDRPGNLVGYSKIKTGVNFRFELRDTITSRSTLIGKAAAFLGKLKLLVRFPGK